MFAVPDHPWVDSGDGAAVRIAMTVAAPGEQVGTLRRVVSEIRGGDGAYEVTLAETSGAIYADLTVGANVAAALALRANEELSNPGVKLHGSGFIVTPDEAQRLGLGQIEGLEQHIREYRNGRDLTQTPRGVMVIDLFGLSAEEMRGRFPAVYQHVFERVKPERDVNPDPKPRTYWWIHGRPREELRSALHGLERYIATVETSKHRFFTFLDVSILPDNMLVNVALDDAYFLGVLSSRIHVTWALATGGTLEDRPRYNKTRCFETFPSPDATPEQRERIRTLAESLDAHRKERLAEHPKLTMTGMYNVLEKIRADKPLEEKERTLHQQGLVSVLRELHDELDEAVFGAYGWPVSLSNEEVLERLVALNAERAAEEAKGLVRWLRPEYQDPEGMTYQTDMGLLTEESAVPLVAQQPWPKSLPEQVQAVRGIVLTLNQPASSADVAKQFKGARPAKVGELLETLALLGQVRVLEGQRYAA